MIFKLRTVLWIVFSVILFSGLAAHDLAAIAAQSAQKGPKSQQRMDDAAYGRQVQIADIRAKMAKNEIKLRQIAQFKVQNPDLAPGSPEFLKRACQCYPNLQSSCIQRDLDTASWGFPLPKSLDEVDGKKAKGLCVALAQTSKTAKIRPACLDAANYCQDLSDPYAVALLEKDQDNLLDRLAVLGVPTQNTLQSGESSGINKSIHTGQNKQLVEQSGSNSESNSQKKTLQSGSINKR